LARKRFESVALAVDSYQRQQDKIEAGLKRQGIPWEGGKLLGRVREASLKLACDFLEASLAEVELVSHQQQQHAAAAAAAADATKLEQQQEKEAAASVTQHQRHQQEEGDDKGHKGASIGTSSSSSNSGHCGGAAAGRRLLRKGFHGVGGTSPEAAAKQLQELLGGGVNFLFKAHQFVGGLNLPAQLLFVQLQEKVEEAWGSSL
jgi:hypothetical protein